MHQIIQQYKPLIDKHLEHLCFSLHDARVPWTNDVAKRLFDLCKRGKTLRGSMLLYTQSLFDERVMEAAVHIAACLELFHAALLIHDDVIDHDRIRRGIDSMHIQYERIGKETQVSNPSQFGEGMAICVGDIGIFSAFLFLSNTQLPARQNIAILKLVTKEFLTVGFGELEDIALGFSPSLPSSKDVLSMYRKKTARYTFSLPMMLGALLSNQPQKTIEMFEELGELLGVIFQLRDDQLAIYGKTQEVGKKAGNDIAQNKNTMYRVLLYERMSGKDKARADTIFGNNHIGREDIEQIQQLISTYDVDDDVQKTIEQISKNAQSIIEHLPVHTEKKSHFFTLVDFIKTRTK
jgi:geranylgeranyl diphosphate synthase type I